MNKFNIGDKVISKDSFYPSKEVGILVGIDTGKERKKRRKMAEIDIKYDDFVDITDKVCPLTFVKAKVAIDELDDGEVLAVRMNDGEPVQNVPRSFKEDGHQVLKLYDNEDGTFTLLVRKVAE